MISEDERRLAVSFSAPRLNQRFLSEWWSAAILAECASARLVSAPCGHSSLAIVTPVFSFSASRWARFLYGRMGGRSSREVGRCGTVSAAR